MIAHIIAWSLQRRLLVLLASLGLAVWGLMALRATPIDALPDLSDVQVIVRTTWAGQAPQIIEDQVTYPLTTTLLAVPGAKSVRGFSSFGDSFVYVVFADGTDLYWARARVLETLNQLQGRLPAGVTPVLGPDASGVGWIYQYALVDRRGRLDLSELRALQDWLLRFELKALPDVSEVATIGGMVRQYQIQLDPARLIARGIGVDQVMAAVRAANQEAGGGVVELAEAEYMVRASGYLRTLEDFETIPLGPGANGTPVLLRDVAHIALGPEPRRGIAELDGKGETVGGVVLLRAGRNASTTIAAVKHKLAELAGSLPEGVEIVTVYDRSQLIERAIDNLKTKLGEELLVVALVTWLFLLHLRSALVAIVTLPLGVLCAFVIMQSRGINANIMSLGGIAIAIGAMVDAAIVMVENAHRRLEQWQDANPDSTLSVPARVQLIGEAAIEVGPALFWSLLIITLSFTPVFALEAQEGRLFGPLAFTKTYAMAAAAGLSVTLVPVLMSFAMGGHITRETSNPLNRFLIALYLPLLNGVLRWPRVTLLVAALALLSCIYPLRQLGAEFMPALDEGDLLYMPTTLPGLAPAAASALLQRTDSLIAAVPEVEHVFGKAGRAETATDPAPLEMFETNIKLKPREQWRAGMTPDKLIAELDQAVQVPGLANLWAAPIRTRIDMLATGIKSPIGVKVAASSLETIDQVSTAVAKLAQNVPGVTSAVAERATGGRYIDVRIRRLDAARFGMSVADVQRVVSNLIGGENIAEVIDGRARYPVNLRYPRELRDSLAALRELPFMAPGGQRLTLASVADVEIGSGPPAIKSENARPSGWVYVDAHGRDLVSVVHDIQRVVAKDLELADGVTLSYAGQFEFFERARERLSLVVPAALVIILMLLYLIFARFDEALLIMVTLPCALVGGIWYLYLLGYHFSIATAIGCIALAGVAAEFGVVMLLYMKHALEAHGDARDEVTVLAAVREGAVLRVRPKAMTVAVIVAGLIPIMSGHGSGSEVMSRIAAPMVGGMLSAPLLSLFVLPAAYFLLRRVKNLQV
ncbi:MAG: efflux RND transporter permease subunit [Gammaproteobacteria bacterium]|nr:efflux RND transporter permease subunit [Gammaproteobacteria bacterium]